MWTEQHAMLLIPGSVMISRGGPPAIGAAISSIGAFGWPGWGHRLPGVLASKSDPEYTLAAPAEINSLFDE